MRIGIDVNCLSYAYRTGIGRITQSLLKQFLRLAPEHHYVLYSALPIDSVVQDFLDDFSNVSLRISRFPSRYVWQQVRLPTLARKDRIDVMLFPEPICLVLLSAPTVVIVLDLGFFTMPKTVAPHILVLNRLLFRATLRKTRQAVAISEFTRQEVLRLFPWFKEKITTVHLGIDHDVFNSTPLSADKRGEVRTSYGLPDEFLLFLGTFIPRKNLQRVVEALRIVHDQGVGVPLVVAGCPGWRNSMVFTRVKRLGLERHVKFLGYVKDDDVPALYKLARGFVFPSLLEGFGLPAIEAMACGTPVITSNTSSLPEIVEDAAIQVNPYDVTSIAKSIVQLLNDQSLRQSLIKRGLGRAQQFTWERTAKKLLGLLTSL